MLSARFNRDSRTNTESEAHRSDFPGFRKGRSCWWPITCNPSPERLPECDLSVLPRHVGAILRRRSGLRAPRADDSARHGRWYGQRNRAAQADLQAAA